MRIDVDRERAARYGLNVADIQDVIETALGGKATTEIWEGEQRFGVVVRLPAGERALEHGAQPARRHAERRPGAARGSRALPAVSAAHEHQPRERARACWRSASSSAAATWAAWSRTCRRGSRRTRRCAAGDEITWCGEFENQQRAMARLSVDRAAVDRCIIFLLLFDAFSSVKSALLILANMPFALIGGILALLCHRHPPVRLGGDRLHRAVRAGGAERRGDGDAIQPAARARGSRWTRRSSDGALVRLRTVLMTALLAMLGLLPMALSHGIGSETQRPLAVVIIGGLVSATLLTLIVLPTFYRALYAPQRGTPGVAGAAS